MSAHAQAQARPAAITSPSVTFRSTGLLQRKCACGGAAGVTGECETCKKKRLALQTKLAVNEPGDVYEREADRVAEEVLSKPARSPVTTAPPRIQRLSGPTGGHVDAAPASVDGVLASPGAPLEPALRLDMEQRFGHDFSKVRVHTGTAARQSAREVTARAYTVGHDVVFDAGQFAPATRDGRRLLAHELTHVVQQGSGQVSRMQRQPQRDLNVDNRALRDGVPVEKWSDVLENQYRNRGEIKRANAMRACRLEGIAACNKILTAAELQVLYDNDITPDKLSALGVATAPRGTRSSSATHMGMAGIGMGAAVLSVAPAPVSPSIPWGTTVANTNLAIANTNVAVAESAVGSQAALRTAPGAVSLGSLAGPAALVGVAVVSGVHWHLWKKFQDKWIAAGYVLLEDPLRVCTSGCHHTPIPRNRPLDDWEGPTEPVSPYPFKDPFAQPLPPGYTELKPFEARPDPTLGRVTPRVKPKTETKARPKPNPRPQDDEDRRKNPCEPHLPLPFGKTFHAELYGMEILSSRLKSAPTHIAQNRQRTSAYERSSKQVPNWDAGIGARINQKVIDRGATFGISPERVIRPNWGPDGKFKQMDVDHIIELQVGWEREPELDRLDNYELLDASTNSSVGPTLDAGIQKERKRLKQTCKTGFDWDEVPLVFVLPMFPAGGKGPGQRWSVAQILKGKHLDVYPRRRGKLT